MLEYSILDGKGVDVEAGDGSTPLYPGLSHVENELRWGFVRKVYGILATQLLLTTVVSAVIVLYTPINHALRDSYGLAVGLCILCLILIFPLYFCQQKHPLNFVFLGLYTICLSIMVGVVCANTKGKIVLEALILTSVVFVTLTGYTFWASKRGKDFSFLEPVLYVGLMILITTSIIQIFYPLGSFALAIYGALGALIFAVYIVYDTDNLIKRFNYDEYIWASVILYVDILNLFLSLLNLLSASQDS